MLLELWRRTTYRSLEIELSVARTCIQLSSSWFLLGNLSAADSYTAEAARLIEFVRQGCDRGVERQFKNDLLNRCDELENKLRPINGRVSD